ncbi:MAG TPA: sugar transferase [Silvibacterium sp.]|nr:sugar transferase [Silvibacterium sp.]
MIRVSNLYLPSRLFVIVAVDGVLLSIAVFLSLGTLSPARAALVSTLSAATLLACFYIFDLYDLDATRKTRDVLLRTLRALGTGFLLLVPAGATFFLVRPSYRILEINLLIFLAILCIYRTASEWLHDWAFPGEKLLLVGSDSSVQLLATALKKHLSLPLKLSAIVPERATDRNGEQAFAMCEDITKIAALTRTFHPDRVAISGFIDSKSPLASELLELRRQGVRIEDAASLYSTISGRVPVALLDIRRLLFGKGLADSKSSAVLNDFFGCIFAAVALLLLAPTLILIAILIKLDSRGPVFYKQERVGLSGRKFLVYKFRSMRQDAEAATGPIWAAAYDRRVTRIGRLLRTLRLDELPQFINVLRGEMALVGPRPERPHFVSVLGQQVPYYDLRHSVRPGITGWAQVSAGYGATIEEAQEKLEYDLFYILNRSLLLDMLIVVKTGKIMLCGKGAR